MRISTYLKAIPDIDFGLDMRITGPGKPRRSLPKAFQPFDGLIVIDHDHHLFSGLRGSEGVRWSTASAQACKEPGQGKTVQKRSEDFPHSATFTPN